VATNRTRFLWQGLCLERLFKSTTIASFPFRPAILLVDAILPICSKSVDEGTGEADA
jgi:hypothetical protein